MIPVTTFRGRTVAVFGLGLSGRASARALLNGGAHIAAWDDDEASRARAQREGIPLKDLREAAWHEFAALVLAPGVPLTHPQPHWTVKRAEAAVIEVIGDTELFFQERLKQGSKAKVVAITGTNGKSTTTALTAHLLREAGFDVAMGGNIGKAVLSLPPFDMSRDDSRVYVLEFSSYQIDLTPSIAPNAAALLNITPDHLDRHGTLDRYARVKAAIFANLGPHDTAVIGIDDKQTRKIADRLRGMGTISRISVKEPVSEGVAVDADATLSEWRGGHEMARTSLAELGALRGAHNWQNAAAAWALVRSLGVAPETIVKGLATFPGLAHRLEIIGRRTKGDTTVLFVNDSKGTNADATANALAAYCDIFWIAGGRAKTGGLKGLERYFSKIRKAYLIGEASAEFADQLSGGLGATVPYATCGSLESAARQASEDAAASGLVAPVVLLSPACASFDQFPNFEVRGDAFCDLVAALGDVEMTPARSSTHQHGTS